MTLCNLVGSNRCNITGRHNPERTLLLPYCLEILSHVTLTLSVRSCFQSLTILHKCYSKITPVSKQHAFKAYRGRDGKTQEL